MREVWFCGRIDIGVWGGVTQKGWGEEGRKKMQNLAISGLGI